MEKTISLKKDKLWQCYKFFIFFDMLVSFRAWFTWAINLEYWGLISTIIGGILYISKHEWFSEHRDFVWIPILYLAIVLGLKTLSPTSIIAALLPITPLLFIAVLHPVYKSNLLDTLYTYMSILLGISFFAWIVHVLGFSWLFIPIPIGYGSNDSGSYQYLYENHFLFLVNITSSYSNAFSRFSSVFVEPGYLGCLMSVLLYLRKYKFDKKNAIFFLALFFTLSLAGIIILVLSFLLYSFKYSQKRIRPTIIVLLLMGALYSIGMNYNDGDNFIKKGIINRIEYDESKQNIVGYNRSTEGSDVYFWNFFIKSDHLLFGGQQAGIDLGGDVDWKAYIIMYGLISFMLVLAFLLYPVFDFRQGRYNFVIFSLIYVLIFTSTFHLFISLMYMVFFILGVNSLQYKKVIKNETGNQ